MLTKQPDYTISELGYPQWNDDKLHRKCRPPPPTSYSHSFSSSHTSSPNRLLPLRETLDDYYKRLLLSEQRSRVENCDRDLDDVVAQQKRHKNQWNVQQQRSNNHNNRNSNHRRNQNCRDKAQATSPARTATTATATATMKATLVTCDLNSF
ncbi:uncharacterized protein LOC133850419 [Drosophila sulfurigaster albostrigata]|uniref:uncharacterized protein LOC133850419 n=1 Tax=Drosophila sulfurigaster albostrigata TaxID=89887 RepID=UPI002D21B036|nr:uncharacterized protein LOC133850419 [Drosophila sulfurigaster albostrigata]